MKQSLNYLIKEYYRKNQSEDALMDIINKCMPDINYLIKNYRDKADMRQEAILKVLKLLNGNVLHNKIDSSEDNLRAYIRMSVANALKDISKSTYKFFNYEISKEFKELESIERDLESCFSLKFILDDLINKLTEKQKEVMKLFYIDDFKASEIAEMKKSSITNINSIKRRAKEAIIANLTLNNIGASETPLFTIF